MRAWHWIASMFGSVLVVELHFTPSWGLWQICVRIEIYWVELGYVHLFLNIRFVLVLGTIDCLLEESHSLKWGQMLLVLWNIINGLLLVVDLGITAHYKLLPEHANGEMTNWGILNIWENRLMCQSLEDQAKESVRIKWNLVSSWAAIPPLSGCVLRISVSIGTSEWVALPVAVYIKLRSFCKFTSHLQDVS